MKKYLVLTALIIFLWLPLVFMDNGQEVNAGIGDGLTDNEKRRLFGETKKLFENLKEITRDLKKVNVRLKDLETMDMGNLKQTHAEILSQVEMVQKLLPDLRGIIEQAEIDLTRRVNRLSTLQTETKELIPAIVGVHEKNFKDLNNRFDKLSSYITQFQLHLGLQNQEKGNEQQQEQGRKNFVGGMLPDLDLIKQEIKKVKSLQQGMLADLGQVQQKIKKDMRTFAESFDGLSRVNALTLQKVATSLNEQNKKTTKANSNLIHLLRSELIPAIENTMIENTDSMIKIINTNLEGQRLANKKIDLLEENLARANGNVMTVGSGIEKLQDSLDKMAKILEER